MKYKWKTMIQNVIKSKNIWLMTNHEDDDDWIELNCVCVDILFTLAPANLTSMKEKFFLCWMAKCPLANWLINGWDVAN